jgi:hypothetical protein
LEKKIIKLKTEIDEAKRIKDIAANTFLIFSTIKSKEFEDFLFRSPVSNVFSIFEGCIYPVQAGK